MDEYTLDDILYRSRVTLLKMLEARGYDVKPYNRFGLAEIKMMRGEKGASEGIALRMDLVKPEPRAGEPKRCVVLYTAQSKKLKQGAQMETFLAERVFNSKVPDALRIEEGEDNEVIIILTDEAVPDPYHAYALKVITDAAEKTTLLHELYLKENETKHLPTIRFHEDMQARWLGLVPDDLVEITRPSPSAGEYTVYRVCLP